MGRDCRKGPRDSRTPLDDSERSLLPCEAFSASRLLLATNLSSRMAGLLFTPETDDMMVIMPCRDIHTFGMRYAIDVAFIDRAGVVRKVARDVLPNKRIRDAGAAAVIERRAIPRELWFEEGEQITLGCFEKRPLPGKHARRRHEVAGRPGERTQAPRACEQNTIEGECDEGVPDLQSALLR